MSFKLWKTHCFWHGIPSWYQCTNLDKTVLDCTEVKIIWNDLRKNSTSYLIQRHIISNTVKVPWKQNKKKSQKRANASSQEICSKEMQKTGDSWLSHNLHYENLGMMASENPIISWHYFMAIQRIKAYFLLKNLTQVNHKKIMTLRKRELKFVACVLCEASCLKKLDSYIRSVIREKKIILQYH